jgi:GntR family transcriptional regulator, transcriptional repressor for pyruvate dehydrogenase complex
VALVPINRTTSAQQVASQILDMIRQGAWRVGDQLPSEKELIEQLSVGRSTIREALQILATVNVVRASPGQGTFVKAPSPAEVFRPELIGFLINNSMALELLEAREMIEPQAVRLAAIRGTDVEFDAIDELLDRHESDNRRGRPVSEHAARFHVMLAKASHNGVVATFMASILEMLLKRGRRIDHIPGYRKLEVDQHRAILAIVRARDPDRAAEAMLEHIVQSATTYDTGGMLNTPRAADRAEVPRPARQSKEETRNVKPRLRSR